MGVSPVQLRPFSVEPGQLAQTLVKAALCDCCIPLASKVFARVFPSAVKGLKILVTWKRRTKALLLLSQYAVTWLC